MAESRTWRRWAFFLVVTLALSLPLGGAYWRLAGQLKRAARERHLARIANQLDQLQEQLNDVKWDALADTYDDTLHLGREDEAELLRQTLMWYVYPDGHCFVEGIAVVDPDGSLRPSRLAAVIDEEGEPLPRSRIAELRRSRPWLEDPWLPDYRFLARAFQEDPEREFYLSPLIPARGRLVFVVASALRDEQGRFRAAVMLQHSIPDLWQNILAPAARGLNLWLMDRRGRLGVANTPLARASAAAFRAEGELERVLQQGKAAAERGAYGARGTLRQRLAQGPALLSYRSEGGNFVVGVVETEAALGAVGRATLRAFGGVAALSLVVLALAGAVYTLASLRRERASVEKATLQRYAGTVSHQVRNHLATLRGYLELIAAGRSGGEAETRELIQGPCQRAVEGIQRTVEELEALSRGEVEIDYEGQLGGDTMYRLPRRERKDGQA